MPSREGWSPACIRKHPNLAAARIDIGAGRIPEDGNHCRRRHEAVAPQGSELAYRHTVSSADKGLSLVEPAHDLAAVVAELALSDGFGHSWIVARRATAVDGAGAERRLHPPPPTWHRLLYLGGRGPPSGRIFS
jgi:hypothetical protein